MKQRILVVLSLILAFGIFAAAYAYSGTNSASAETIQIKVERSDEDCCQKGADCCKGGTCCHKKK